MSDVSLKGQVLGCVAMLVIDIPFGFLLLAIMMSGKIYNGMSEVEILDVLEGVTNGELFLSASLVVGTLTTVFGGYIVARVAKRAEYLNALIFGVLGMLIGYLLSGDLPMWFLVVAQLTTIPASLLGGYFAASGSRRNA